MPQRSFNLLLVIALVTLLCYQRAEQSRRHDGMVDTFAQVLDEIEDGYVVDVDKRELFEAALQAMTSKLDDYSRYIPPELYQQFQESLDLRFGGVGVQVSIDQETKRITVTSPLVGTPAFKAGMRAGDQILKIDGTDTEGFSLADAVDLMRGAPGEPVLLTVLQKGETEPVEFKIIRDVIKAPSVIGDRYLPDGSWDFMLEGTDHIGYIRLDKTFGPNTPQEVREALERLTKAGMKGLILDVRDNPGGLLDSAVEICDLFVSQGKIVSTRYREDVRAQRDTKTYNATAGGTYMGFPMAVLINGQSASASEIVAACLQDHDRAIVVGERSYGKGSVQSVIDLEGGRSALKLTIASYWRPSGKNINRFAHNSEQDEWGVRPNPGYEVKLEGEELGKAIKYRQQRDVYQPEPVTPTDPDDLYFDPQLQRAIEAVKEQLTDEKTVARKAS